MTKLIEASYQLGTMTRRGLMSGMGKAVLSASAVAMLAACETAAKTDAMAHDPERDIGILNFAAGKEMEAIAAYQLGAESGLLSKGVLDIAVSFQSHHKSHRDALLGVVQKMGGTPAQPKSMAEYASDLNAASLKSEMDVLKLALGLEKGAADAYLGAIPQFGDSQLSAAAGRIAADEVMHWTVLAGAVGAPLPTGAMSFGA